MFAKMKKGFDNEKYLKAQANAIIERASVFKKLYLEVGGKLCGDQHAVRVLPGYEPNVKVHVLQQLKKKKDFEVLYCLSAKDLARGKIRADLNLNYAGASIKTLNDLRGFGFDVSAVVINRFSGEPEAIKFRRYLENIGMKVHTQPEIKGYPNNVKKIVSAQGYGKGHHIKTEKNLVVVTGAGPGSGKMSTCLSQMYHENKSGTRTGFSKFETFPIWNIPLEHPVNLAYEAATADIADKNMPDPFYFKRKKTIAINYNRDVENFRIIRKIIEKIIGKLSREEEDAYGSPTEIALNMTKEGIVDDAACREAAKQEIIRRYFNYKKDMLLGIEPKETLARVEALMQKLKIAPEYRKAVVRAREAMEEAKKKPGKGNRGVFCGAALQLSDGRIAAGKNSPLLHAESACILNAIKVLAGVADKTDLLPNEVVQEIARLKEDVLRMSSESLNVEEVLIALAISAKTNPAAKIAMGRLKELRGCDMHATHLLSMGDDSGLRKLGVIVTTDSLFTIPRYTNVK